MKISLLHQPPICFSFQGDYTPSVATYKHAKVRFNFGPKFRHPPKNVKLRPMSARAEEASIDQTVADMRFFTEKQGKLRLDNYSMSPQICKCWHYENKYNNILAFLTCRAM